MPIPTLLLPFEGDSIAGRDRNGIVTPVASGPVRYTAGASPASQAYVAEEGTTNLFRDPFVQNNSLNDYWSWFSTGSVYSRSVSTAHPDIAPRVHETYVESLVPGATRSVDARTSVSGLMGQVTGKLTAKFSKVITGTAYTRVDYTDATWEDTAGVGFTLSPDSPTEIIFPVATTNPAKTVSGVRLGLTIAYADWIGHRLWYAKVQIENRSYTTSFCPQLDTSGNLLPGYTWAGTAHASASTRAASSVSIAYPDTFGEAAIRYSEDDGQTWQTAFLMAPGAVGTRGTLALSGGVLTLSAGRAVRYDGLVVFDLPLTSAERTTLVNAPSWRWDTLVPRVGGILRIGVPSQVGGLLRGDDLSGVGGIMRIGGG